MSFHQYLIDHAMWVDADKVEAVIKSLQEKDKDLVPSIESKDPSEILSDLAAQVHWDLSWSDNGDIDGLMLADSYTMNAQETFMEALATQARPGSFINMIGEDQVVWQWYFDHGKLFERDVKIQGVPHPDEATAAAESADESSCKHEPDVQGVTPADGAPGIIDVICTKCGTSGSMRLLSEDINWEE